MPRASKSHNGTETETPNLALGICGTYEFHQSWINRKLVSPRSPQTFIQRCQEIMMSLVEAAFHRLKWFCKQWKRFYLQRLFRLGARFHNFVGNDWFARWCINFLGGIEVPGQRPNHEISISVLEPRQEEPNNS